ncbi:hypothetical protein QWY75_12545 [Pontixanthobacter aestiaquae]|uniref:J domain-containing protein n=1 Tax=Pontixanthobacter aestiaquae TaxID=1509367 RepID=A0A844Z7V5_9SPHN|nr:hypothetical protein [Pontixanthobacter aestiaquae]MDN3647033.1 hypothetical protein [Pontixanthobacter aestiaquae]MXO81989.1 hypothetical protein [Pontixanthobacter aestiaquae]
MTGWPWNVLGIEATDDKGAIRKAYAEKLKSLDIDKEIAAFSDLRAARDYALSNAGFNVRDDTAEDDESYGEDTYDDDGSFDFDVEFSAADLIGFGVDPFGPPGLDSFGQGHVPEASPELNVVAGSPRHDPVGLAYKELSGLLFPDGERSDDAMEWEEFEQAQAALDNVLDYAGKADLQTEQGIDYWLSDMLAEAWPRSAPLVEQASNAFNWTVEEGKLTERPALSWLNARLRGMRYHEAVTQQDHPNHKAWMYLSEPGEYRWWHAAKVNGTAMHKLIAGVREYYPELESYLEPRKVAALEEGVTGFVPGAIRLLFVLFLISIPLRYCGDSESPEISQIPIFETAFDGSPEMQQQADIFAIELFGPDATYENVEKLNSEIGSLIRSAARLDSSDMVFSRDSSLSAESAVRALTMQAVVKAGFEDLLKIKQLQLDLLRESRSAGDAACAAFLTSGKVDDAVELSTELRDRERSLAWNLLQQGLLDRDANAGGAAQASVPGWVVGEIIDSTSLSRDAVDEALGDAEANGACNVHIALLQSALRQPGRVPAELLRLQ